MNLFGAIKVTPQTSSQQLGHVLKKHRDWHNQWQTYASTLMDNLPE